MKCGRRPSDPQAGDSPHFGGGSRVYNVIDSRQSYLQDVVVAGLRALDFPKQADNSIHFSYEMVALSPRTCIEMGIELSDEDKRRAVRGGVRPQGPGRESRRPDRQADREGAGRSDVAARGGAGGVAAAGGDADRDRRAALLHAEVHAQFGDRFRFRRGAELRGRDRAVRAVRGGARAQHSAQAGRARREAAGFPRRACRAK